MREALPAQLWLGNAVDGRDVRQLFQAGVRAVVDLAAEELPASLPREVIYCRFPLIDSAGNSSDVIRLAVSTLVKLLRQHVCTLVCCSGGVSRSPTIAAFAIARFTGCTPEESLHEILAGQPSDVSPELWNEVATILKRHRNKSD